MIRQLVAVKKDNTRLCQSIQTAQASLKESETENERILKSKSMMMGSGKSTAASSKVFSTTLPSPLDMGVENKYKGIIKRLKVSIVYCSIFVLLVKFDPVQVCQIHFINGFTHLESGPLVIMLDMHIHPSLCTILF